MTAHSAEEIEDYRKRMLIIVCTKKHVIVIHGGDDPKMNKVAREANMLTKIPLYDRHKILKFIHVKPLSLEAWK